MTLLWRLVRLFPLVLVSAVMVLVSVAALVAEDLVWAIAGQSRKRTNTRPSTAAASVVIPNWNGRDLLEKYLPSVEKALAGNPKNELIVVDNGSADGSANFVRQTFPRVKLMALYHNLGFGGGSNPGVRRASNHLVLLLNHGMCLAPDF